MSEVPKIIEDFLKGNNDAGGTIASLEDEGKRLASELSKKVNGLCGWSLNLDETDFDSGTYETSCGKYFGVIAGTPKDNEFIYCIYCGRKIYEIEIPKPPEW